MIQSIELFNFRLHRHLKIDFSKHVTSIVGRSYAGKSTIIRAIKWVCLNKPSGTSMIRWGKKRAKVILTVDGHKIVRIRSKSENIYKLDGEVFKAFGNDVPQKIARILNIADTNFQGQHALPFWFGETAGEVSRKLNGIVNLSIIDQTLSNLASEVRKAKSTVEVTQSRLAEAKQAKAKLAYVPEMAKEWENVQAKQKEYLQIEAETEQLEEMLAEAQRLKTLRDQAKPPAIITLNEAYEAYRAASNAVDRVEKALGQAKRLQAQVKDTKEKAVKLNEQVSALTKDRCPLCGK